MLRPFVCPLTLALVGLSGLARADAPAVPSYTLPEALAQARAHQPLIRRALASFRAQRAEAQVARAEWYPQLGVTAQLFAATSNQTTASYLNVPEVDLPRIGGSRGTASTHWTPAASTLAAISIGQEVYDFGRIAALAAVGDALAEAAQKNAQLAALDVQLAVEEAYHGVLAARGILRATDEALRRARTHRDYAQAGTKSGLRPPIELTRARADVALLEVDRVRAEAGLAEAQAALAAAIGSTALAVDAREVPPEAEAAPAFDELLRAAERQNPQLGAALARLHAEEARARALTRQLLPDLFASATLSGRAGGALPSSGLAADVPYGHGALPDVGNWDLGLVFRWNLLDLTVLRRRDAARARAEAAQADVELVRTQVTLAAERAWLQLDAAQKALPGLAESARAAQANQAQAEARFRAGLGTSVELADAEALLTRAELALAIGRFEVARARALLGYAVGERLIQLPEGK